jgi:hypothetical protein
LKIFLKKDSMMLLCLCVHRRSIKSSFALAWWPTRESELKMKHDSGNAHFGRSWFSTVQLLKMGLLHPPNTKEHYPRGLNMIFWFIYKKRIIIRIFIHFIISSHHPMIRIQSFSSLNDSKILFMNGIFPKYVTKQQCLQRKD